MTIGDAPRYGHPCVAILKEHEAGMRRTGTFESAGSAR